MAATLDCGGFEVTAACDGVEALLRLAGDPLPCVVLLDLHMPRMGGAALRRAMQGDGRLASVPVVLWSADDARAHEAAGLDVAAVLPKSVDPDELLAILARLARCPGPLRPETIDGEPWHGGDDTRASYRSPTTTATPSGSPSACDIPPPRDR